jgi:hypothetical protein
VWNTNPFFGLDESNYGRPAALPVGHDYFELQVNISTAFYLTFDPAAAYFATN